MSVAKKPERDARSDPSPASVGPMGGTSSVKPEPEADALGWPEGPDASANPG